MFFFVKQKTAYEMRISDWSSDVCSSDLLREQVNLAVQMRRRGRLGEIAQRREILDREADRIEQGHLVAMAAAGRLARDDAPQLGRGEIGGHLLNLALDPRLRQILDEEAGAVEDRRLQQIGRATVGTPDT